MMMAEKHTGKHLSELLDSAELAKLELADHVLSTIISGISADSRKVVPGDMFLAVSGYESDGRDYIEQAITSGSSIVLAEKTEEWSPSQYDSQSIPVVTIENLSEKISAIAGKFYNNPSQRLSLIGVTGTNGKTSCTHIMMQLLNLIGKSCGCIGTIGCGVDGELKDSVNTTPGPIELQEYLAKWSDQGVGHVVMEVSSHGLSQGRVAALTFQLALFTNISRDHLDYHGDMQTYIKAKAKLFQMPGLKIAVINADDASAEAMFKAANVNGNADVACYGYGLKKAKHANDRSLWLENIRYHDKGVSAELFSPWGQYHIESPLLGGFNLSNLLGSITSLAAIGYSLHDVINQLPSLKTVSGRMERVAVESDISVVVDYAHTPDGLEKALEAMRQHAQGKLWCVFGCGGDRDQGKRPLMGEVAQRFADHMVVTTDNPRTENPATIIDEILSGVDSPSLVEEDRAKAITACIKQAKPGDCVLIAGKGHEDYQIVGKDYLPFSDIKQARLALAERARLSGGAE